MANENTTPSAADGDTTEPEASSPTGDLKPPPTDTGWLKTEHLREKVLPPEANSTTEPPPDEGNE